uniref:Metabotropic glutamate receptor 3-like n=1 Tax=Saccoglossus kowalevskii TaxID=10224 RepID=A0ABM0MZ47_SACKO|nr:PREDICTED: metabotropic glutamate receptor 3-like [Saccoglossus kowalevskii]
MTSLAYSKPGDIVLAGLFSIHEFGGDRQCTDLRELEVLQKIESMVYAIEQISYYATSDELSDVNRFPFFLRTVPPDRMQVQAIVELLLKFKWNYISIVNSDESYAKNGVKYLKAEIAKHDDICIATSLEVSRFNSEEEIDGIVNTLREHGNAKVVVVFSVPLEANMLMSAVRRANASDEFVWIASDAWGPNLHLYGNLPAAVGGLFIKIYSQEVRDFENYFKSLNTNNRQNNPWFGKFWDRYLKCTLTDTCLENPYIPGFSKESLVSLIIDAVYTFAHGLEAARYNLCGKQLTCIEMYNLTGEDTIGYLRNVSFEGTTGQVSFDENGDILGKYIIKTLQHINGTYQFVTVGIWDSLRMAEKLELNTSGIQWNHTNEGAQPTQVPSSVCSEPCPPGHFIIQGSPRCCWSCFQCDEDEIAINGSLCLKCPELYWPNEDFTSCELLPYVYLKWYDAWGIALATLASIGTVSTIVILILYIKYRNRSLIKASGRELSFMIIFGALLSYLIIFLYIGKPSPATCVMYRLGFTFSCVLLYAPLMTKVNRIYRIFTAGKKSTRRPPLISPTSQVVIACILILFQVVISLVFVILVPPDAVYTPSETDKRKVELLCNIQTSEIIASFSYNIILIILCCFYAFKTRHLPDNYNESRFIAFSIYTTLVVSLAFIPTYFAINSASLRVVILSVATVLNATITLVFMYVPKIYAVHFVGQANVKAYGSSGSEGGVAGARVRVPVPRPHRVSPADVPGAENYVSNM